ncbi:MAG: hypothetical protein HC792_06255, partial [Acaryochloridaceae cyanobacterium CSU_5_19]|nr:hypothetical protein [Acaryochloridaceae cyanobacterium CSU_5_19]
LWRSGILGQSPKSPNPVASPSVPAPAPPSPTATPIPIAFSQVQRGDYLRLRSGAKEDAILSWTSLDNLKADKDAADLRISRDQLFFVTAIHPDPDIKEKPDSEETPAIPNAVELRVCRPLNPLSNKATEQDDGSAKSEIGNSETTPPSNQAQTPANPPLVSSSDRPPIVWVGRQRIRSLSGNSSKGTVAACRGDSL